MIDISVQNLVKSFEEGENILDGLTFDVTEGEHVGILGKNGAGKTTLFRIIAGEISADEGEVVLAPSRRLGLISQIPVYPRGYTVEDVLKTAHLRLDGLKRRMDELAARMAAGDDSAAVLREYDRVSYDFERSGGYDTDYERDRVANGLEIPAAQRHQEFETLSGGEKTRVNLARLILENTDILLMDEPTNHLDMRASEWLENYLSTFRGTVLVISHDRYFLDRAVSRVIELDRGRAVFYSGNYSFFVEEKQRRYEEQLKKYQREQAEIRRLQESADRLYQWGTGNKNLMKKSFAIRSRIDRIATVERPDTEKRMRARFSENEFRADEAVVIKGVSKSFGDKMLFSDVELEVTGGERIAVIGDNGAGKSTLIKLIMDEEQPDTGYIRLGPAVKKAYLPQLVRFDEPHRSLVDTLIYEDNCSPQTARNRLGAFKFSGEDVFKQVADLSGGEKSRLRLCMLMNESINLLILDEPTNHLDIVSREWMEEALEDYSGTLIFVSHDRYFINRFATRIWEVRDGAIRDFRGGFEAFRAAETRREQAERARRETVKRAAPKKQQKRGGESLEKQIARLEREIARGEGRRDELDRLREEHATDYEKLMEIETEYEALSRELEAQYEEWGILSEQEEKE